MARKPFKDKRQVGLFDQPIAEDAAPQSPSTNPLGLKTDQEPVFNAHYWVMSETNVCYCDTSRMDIAMEEALAHSMAQKNPVYVCMGPGTDRVPLGR